MGFQGISPILEESVSAATATNSVQLGTRATVDGNDYIYVYNSGNAQISQGQGGFLPSASLSAFSGSFVVSVSNAASQAGSRTIVGVAHNATIATNYYGWLCTRGVVYAVPDASAVSANSGVELVPGVDGGFVAYAGTSATGTPVGYTLNSFVTTVGTGKIAFKSPLFS